MRALFRLEDVVFQDKIKYRNIVIQEKCTTFIIGKSGSGKSTLLSLLNRSQNFSQGMIYYKDKSILEYDPLLLRKEVLVVSQSVFLFHESIRENFVRFYRYRDETVCTDGQIKRLLEVCNLDFSLDHDVTYMSGGEKQRLYIAIFLSFLPNVLLLDEPTSALDYKNAITVLDNILAFAKEKDITLIVVSHDEKIVGKYQEKIVSLDEEDS